MHEAFDAARRHPNNQSAFLQERINKAERYLRVKGVTDPPKFKYARFRRRNAIALNEFKEDPEVVYNHPRFTAYPERQIVVVDHQERKLTPIENEILRILLQQRNRVVSNGNLSELLWGEDASAQGERAKWHMSRLRKKIESDPSKPTIIINIRGQGYSLRDETRENFAPKVDQQGENIN